MTVRTAVSIVLLLVLVAVATLSIVPPKEVVGSTIFVDIRSNLVADYSINPEPGSTRFSPVYLRLVRELLGVNKDSMEKQLLRPVPFVDE